MLKATSVRKSTPQLALAYDPRCLLHENGSMVVDAEAVEWLNVKHAENPDRIHRALEVLVASGVASQLDASAQAHASERYGYHTGHMGILRDPGPVAHVLRLLNDAWEESPHGDGCDAEPLRTATDGGQTRANAGGQAPQ